MQELILISKITCPHCGYSKIEFLADTPLTGYECRSCHAVLLPKAGECCIFCSYGSVRCINKQRMLVRYR
ncbi:MAG: GDCCVxC domain-containing (seleno)protein [Bacteroidota bacterium]